MAKGTKKKPSDRATPDEELTKLTADCPTSSAVSEASAVPASAPSVARDELDEPPGIRKEPALSHIIVHRYEGERCGELFHGEGVAVFQGGHVYKGSFADGLMHGHGEYMWADGVKYEGEFVSNAPVGHGIYTWLDGSAYEGEVWYGIRHGVGTYKCGKTSSVYKGQWHQGKRHGRGIICYNQEVTSWYEGDWKNNLREGWGVRCYPSGNIYQGQWRNDVRHGEGTMRWVQLGQQYSGQWVAGIQHGQGTHTWFLKRGPGSQYPLRNEYKGELVQGLRHGHGTFSYASGAVYSGGWKHNKKHGQGKFVFKNGRIFEGEFIEDRMAEFPAFSIDGAKTPDLSGIRTHSPPPDGSDVPRRAKKSASVLGPDMVLNIETLLKQIPEAQRDQELRQVEFAILRHIALLRAIYSFYSSLGHDYSPDNTFLLTRLQFWRFLKDCGVHLHGITLAQMDRLIDGDVFPEDVYSPFSTMLLRKCLSYIVIAAYHIYHKDIGTTSNVLVECFSKLIRKNIIPNAKNVKGPLFTHPLQAVIGKNYIDRCWEIYQTFCKASSAALSDQAMTARHFIWMLKNLGLFDSELTTARVLEILSLENPAIYSTTHSNLDLEITFLEFFEALLYCAEVKTMHEVRTETVRSLTGETKDSPLLSQQAAPQYESATESTNLISSPGSTSAAASDGGPPPLDQGTDSESMLAGVKTESHTEATSCTSITDAKVTTQPCTDTEAAEDTEQKLECWIQKTHHFFTEVFFPAFEQNLLLKEKVQEERTRLSAQNRVALEKAKEKARLREQEKAEEERRRVEEEEENGNDPGDDLNHSSLAFLTPVAS
ncbi:radial spoke head 10 homolog B [Salminus brasiliensis]|uniref:radial spoke head 10 homolog B n=1 Tax=Salminus brasiliensis TaxID=930266 RepID=UPI003B82EF4D